MFAAATFLAARALDHRSAPLNTLALSATCLLAASPLSVVDAGFLLAFGAKVGILLGVPPILSHVRPMLEPAGRRNAFGHPNPKVLRRYAEVGAVVLQTPEVGAVSLRSDGRRVVVETQRGPTLAFGRLLDPHPLTLHLVRRYISERHVPLQKALLEQGEPS